MNEDPVVLVTGGAKRIGAAIVRHFHRNGFRIIVHYHHSRAEADSLLAELNGERAGSASAIQASLTDSDQVQQLARQSLESFGRVDVLVNNASAYYPTPLADTSQENWDELLDSNLRAAFFLVQQLAPMLTTQDGAVVNIIDALVEKPMAGYGPYSIAKAGLLALTRTLAEELAPQVRINAVAPGAILWPPGMEDSDDPDILARQQKILQQIPLGKLGEPEQIAETVYFLATQASYMTGCMIRVDGGRSLA